MTAGHGRALAESVREPAPQSLRETVRAMASSGSAPAQRGEEGPGLRHGLPPRRPVAGRRDPRRHRRAAVLVASAVAVFGLGLAAVIGTDGGARHESHQQVLRAAVAVYANALETPTAAPPPVPRIGSMELRSTGTTALTGNEVTVFRYGDPAADHVVLMLSVRPFPRADRAHDIAGDGGWLGQVSGTAVYCRDTEGASWLVLAPTSEQALDAGRRAGLLPGPPPAPPAATDTRPI